MPQDESITAPRTDDVVRLFGSFMDAEPHPALLLDSEGRVHALNRVARRELPGLSPGGDLIRYCADPSGFRAYLMRCAGTGGPLPGAVTLSFSEPSRWRCNGGAVKPAGSDGAALILLRLRSQIEAHSRFLALTEKVNALNAALRRQEQIQGELEGALAAKNILLAEVQHRIKNNLQIVLSMLSLAMKSAPDPVSRACLADVANRVNAMGAVHALLYASPDLVEIDASQLLALLASAAEQAYGRPEVRLSVEAQPIALGADSALSLALIVNELLANAFKHAFCDGRSGTVRILLSSESDAAQLAILDDGAAFGDNSAGTGLTLVRALAAKLGGAVVIERGGAKRVSISFPLRRTMSARHIH